MRNFLDNRYTYAKLSAGVGMAGAAVLFLLCWLSAPDFLCVVPLVIWLGGTAGAYICGGLFTALRMALNIAKWGLVAVPFPFNIAAFLCAAFYALVVFFFVPLIPVCKAEKEYAVR